MLQCKKYGAKKKTKTEKKDLIEYTRERHNLLLKSDTL